jgi:predicted PhzF superfamily epimerase YddE/YHI9
MKLYIVDAFTSEPFKGNPAAVLTPTETPLEAGLMQKIAFEMNLSETAFLVPRPGSVSGDPGGAADFELRWFTPKVEVDLCGHATLASAHVLWETGRVKPGITIRFHTRSGVLSAKPIGETFSGGGENSSRGDTLAGIAAARNGRWVELDFPTEPPEASSPPEGLLRALGVQPLYVGKTRFDFFVETVSEETVRKMRPDFGLLEKVQCRGVIVTAKGTDCDFVSRFFAPAVGVREDPVTGSAHCSLAPYWSGKLGKDAFTAHQVSERGGTLRVRAAGGRTLISGQAVTVLEGKLVHKGR